MNNRIPIIVIRVGACLSNRLRSVKDELSILNQLSNDILYDIKHNIILANMYNILFVVKHFLLFKCTINPIEEKIINKLTKSMFIPMRDIFSSEKGINRTKIAIFRSIIKYLINIYGLQLLSFVLSYPTLGLQGSRFQTDLKVAYTA